MKRYNKQDLGRHLKDDLCSFLLCLASTLCLVWFTQSNIFCFFRAWAESWAQSCHRTSGFPQTFPKQQTGLRQSSGRAWAPLPALLRGHCQQGEHWRPFIGDPSASYVGHKTHSHLWRYWGISGLMTDHQTVCRKVLVIVFGLKLRISHNKLILWWIISKLIRQTCSLCFWLFSAGFELLFGVFWAKASAKLCNVCPQ